MAPLSQSGAAFGAGNPTNVLNEIRDIGNGVNGIEQNLQQLRMLQDRALNETDSNSGTSRQLDQLSADTMASYRELVQRVRELKSKPDARSYQGQVDRIDRQLKSAIQQFQEVESSHRQKMQGQMERQYRIVRPDADQNEVRAAVEDMSTGGQQVFQQAMMQSNRQGQARAVLNEVQNRHRELLKIEQQMTELAQLMQDLDTIIIQQEEPLMKIEQQAEDTVQQLEEANVHLDKANESARATRRKKWICLGICGMSPRYQFPRDEPKRLDADILFSLCSPHCRYHCCDRRRLFRGDEQEQQQQHQHHQHGPRSDRDLHAIFGTARQGPGRCEKHCWSVRATSRGPRQHSKDRDFACSHARCRELKNHAKLSMRGTPNMRLFLFRFVSGV